MTSCTPHCCHIASLRCTADALTETMPSFSLTMLAVKHYSDIDDASDTFYIARFVVEKQRP